MITGVRVGVGGSHSVNYLSSKQNDTPPQHSVLALPWPSEEINIKGTLTHEGDTVRDSQGLNSVTPGSIFVHSFIHFTAAMWRDTSNGKKLFKNYAT